MREETSSAIVTGSGAAGDPTSVTSGSATPPPCSTRSSTASWAAAAARAGSTPRSKRREASDGSRCRRAERATDTGSKCAASMRTRGSRRRPRSPEPPMTPATADGALAATVGDEQVAGVEGGGDVVERGDPFAGTGPPHDDRRLEGGEVEGVEGLAEAEHDVVRDVDRQRDGAHARLGEPRRHPAGRGRGDVDAADHAGDVAVAAGTAADGVRVGEHDGEAGVGGLGRLSRELERRVAEGGARGVEYSRATPRTEKQYPRSGVTLTSTVSRSSPSSGSASVPGTRDPRSSASPAKRPRQHEDAVVVVADPELTLGADHPGRDVAVRLSRRHRQWSLRAS